VTGTGVQDAFKGFRVLMLSQIEARTEMLTGARYDYRAHGIRETGECAVQALKHDFRKRIALFRSVQGYECDTILYLK
jgi:hypothetical protein